MLSIPHLIIIFVVALVVFGPEKLPELARNLGKVMGEFRRATGELRSTFEGHMRDLERETESRRIGGAAQNPAASAGVEPVPIAKPGMTSSLGTVPALPSHLAPQVGAPIEGQEASAPESTSEGSGTDAPPASPRKADVQSETHPESEAEIISDGGTRPA